MAMFANQMAVYCMFLLNFLFVSTCAMGLSGFRSDPNACQTNCTHSNDRRTEACMKGCRLYSICQWVTEPGNSTQTLQECHSACSEAYEKQDLLKSCQDGCAISKSSNEALNRVFDPFNQNNNDDVFGTGIFDYADSLMNDFMNSAWQSLSMMQSFMPFAADTEIIDISDGTHHDIIIIQHHQPEINTEYPNKKLSINTENDKSKSTEKENIETNLQTNANSPGSFGVFSLYRRNDEPDLADTAYDHYWQKLHKSWWSCFTKKQGLPELVFTLFWISTFLLLLLSCCIQFGPKPQLSVNGDLAFIRDSEGKLPTYMKTYPAPDGAKVSPYFSASVVSCQDKKPLLCAQQY